MPQEMTQEEFDAVTELPVAAEPIEAVALSLTAAGLMQAAQRVAKLEAAGLDCSGVSIYVYADDKEKFQKACRALGTFRKEASDDAFYAKAAFDGGVGITIYVPRAQMCVRRQVGTKVIPEQIIPAREVPVYEYDCTQSVLTADKPEALPNV